MTLPETVINVVLANSRYHAFVEWGVVIYDLHWRELSRARLGNVTCGTVNDVAVWLGTSTAGVYRLPLNTINDATDDLVQIYHTGSGTPLASMAVQCIAGVDAHLLVGTDVGIDFIDSPGTVYSYTDANGVDACAINSTQIAYAPGGGNLHVLNHPTADWVTGDATVLTTASTPAIVSNTVQALAWGTDLFIGTAAGVSAYDGTNVTNYTVSAIGTVVDVKAVHPASDATDTAGLFAYATSNGSDGGRFGIYDMTGSTNLDTVSGDATSAWVADDVSTAVYNDTLAEYAYVRAVSPGHKALRADRAGSIYAEVVDTLDGIASGSVELKINDQAVAETITAITDGYKIEFDYTAGYNSRVKIGITATDNSADLNPISFESWFTTELAPEFTVTPVTPPNIEAVREISLTASEADELIGSVYVVWGDERASRLIITDAQAEAVGWAALDETTFHRTIHTVKVKEQDDSGTPVRTGQLQKGDTVAITCTALSLSSTDCEVLAVQRSETLADGLEYTLVLAEYTAV